MNATLRLLLLLPILAWTTTQASAVPGRAEVVKVIGKATVTKSAGGSGQTITAGMVLGTGDTINTGAGSTVDLNLGLNGDFLRVDPDSSLTIGNLDIANVAERTVNTQLNVNRGGITGNVVNKLSVASKYEIKTASGVAGIRGTVYSVQTDGAGKITRIVVTSGTVTITDGGVMITISAADRTARAYSPPEGRAPTSADVQSANRQEADATRNAGANLQSGSSVTNIDGAGTVINNPADVSTSIRDLRRN